MSASRTFHDLTARPVTPRIQEWLHNLAERFGEDELVATMLEQAPLGDIDKVMERTRHALATRSAHRAPTINAHLEGEALMDIVLGHRGPPPAPWTYDTRGLTKAQYSEVLTWAEARREAAGR